MIILFSFSGKMETNKTPASKISTSILAFVCRYSYLLSLLPPKHTIMRPQQLLATSLLVFSFFLLSCGGKDKKDENKTTNESTTKPSTDTDDGMVPKIDTGSLTDEASILDAIQKVADARIADDKKQKEDPNYSGHYLELTKLYTAVLKASTAYSQTIKDPAKALEFTNKFSAIQDKMYAK